MTAQFLKLSDAAVMRRVKLAMCWLASSIQKIDLVIKASLSGIYGYGIKLQKKNSYAFSSYFEPKYNIKKTRLY